VLFNTLAFAKFFAVVFVVTWLLLRRQLVLWVPWVAVFATTLFNTRGLVARDACAVGMAVGEGLPCFDTLPALLCLLLGGFTWLLFAYQGNNRIPRIELVFVACVSHALTLTWLTQVYWGKALATLVITSLVPDLDVWPWLGLLPAQVLVALAASAAATLLLCIKQVRSLFLLGASYYFYAQWDWHFLPLIFASSTIDYLLARTIAGTAEALKRKRWLIATLALNLGVLFLFKYLNFGIDSVRMALSSIGYHPPHWALEVALPIGVSFFTFESMSYVIDVYRGDIEPHDSYLEYLTFVAFFPHLVAGPIVRPRDLLPQLSGALTFTSQDAGKAAYLVCWGLLKKVAIGDYLALNLVDRVFDAPNMYSSLECYVAIVAYAVQIYCDFSGYTDIAIGCALLLGIHFPRNFNAPYQALNIQDFWRRWHISLSTWLRDYLYLPLGGSRRGRARTYFNLLVVMLLGGLWHGASWTFVVWGGLHGVALAAHRAYTRTVGRTKVNTRPTGWKRLGFTLLTFHFVCFAWVFFRADSLTRAGDLFAQMAELTTFTPNLDVKVLIALALGLGTHWLPERLFQKSVTTFAALPAPAQGLALCVVTLILREVMSADMVPFVYFQF
jgi:alginate O-acetyltransferase complex protein AlgI